MTDLRLLPDVELLIQDVLTDCPSSTRLPQNAATKVPWRTVNKLGGSWSHPLFLDKPQVVVDSFAASEDEAIALGESARVLLVRAWLSQTRTAHGVIHRLNEVSSPFVVRTGTSLDGVAHVSATYQVFTRP